MNKPGALILIVGLAFIVAIGAMAGHSANAATPSVALASTADFSILAAPAAIAGTQSLPSTSTDDPSGPLTALGVALTGTGVVLLRRRPVPHL